MQGPRDAVQNVGRMILKPLTYPRASLSLYRGFFQLLTDAAYLLATHPPTTCHLPLNTSPPTPSPTAQVPYQRMYEPWFIGHNSMVPFHDVKFRGYGLNKIAHVASLNYYNYSFVVLPHAWLVHRPHEDTAVGGVVLRLIWCGISVKKGRFRARGGKWGRREEGNGRGASGKRARQGRSGRCTKNLAMQRGKC